MLGARVGLRAGEGGDLGDGWAWESTGAWGRGHGGGPAGREVRGGGIGGLFQTEL